VSQENVELVRGLYAEWEKGNFWSAELYAPDVEWHWSSAAKAVRGGSASYKGLDEIGSAMREWVTEWGWWSISAEQLIDAGDRVVVLTTLHARLKDGRGEVHDQGADVITLRDGRIIRMDIFDTPEEALEAAGLRE
jgi:ketosteroid isomerase-like protein